MIWFLVIGLSFFYVFLGFVIGVIFQGPCGRHHEYCANEGDSP